jgi:hypothetical protein
MPCAPKPQPPKRCGCAACKRLRHVDSVRVAYMQIIADSYDRDELKVLVRAARATMLPKDPP